MAKTLDELQALLAGHGSACQQMLDAVLAKRLETPTSKTPPETSGMFVSRPASVAADQWCQGPSAQSPSTHLPAHTEPGTPGCKANGENAR
jgi:hypothetical protein